MNTEALLDFIWKIYEINHEIINFNFLDINTFS